MKSEEKWPPLSPTLPERAEQRTYTVLDLQREEPDSYAYLRAYWKIISKRRWTILTVALVVITLVAIYTYKKKPVFRATAEVEVNSETPQVQSVNDLYQSVPTDPAFLQTQVDVLNSDNLAWQTIQQLKLDRDPAFNPLASLHRPAPAEKLSARQTRLIGVFRKALHVELVTGSRMIKVSFESTDPRLAEKVANTLVHNYREYNFLTKYDATRQASGWMEDQLDELKAKVKKSQRALVDYERQNSIVNIGGKVNMQEQRLADLSQDLTVAQNDLAEKQALYQLVEANPGKVGLLSQDSLLENMEEKYADLKTSYVNALGQYGPNFPEVVRLRDQINEIRSLIKQEQKLAVERIAHNYQASLGRVKLLAASVEREKVKAGNLNQLMIQYDLLQHEFKTNQQLYDNLLTRVKDASVSAGLRANNVQIVDRALAPSVPVSPRKRLNLAIALVVGLALGTALAFVREVMDTSIKTAEDVERSIAEPVLGVIPSIRSLDQSKPWFRRRRDGAADGKVEWAVLKHPTSALAESYHTLRTAVLLSSAPRPPQALLVTSTQPAEGKTSTAFNLAIGLTQIGRKVLFIDADMRQPGLKRTMDASGHAGLSSVLTGAGKLEEALFQLPDLPNLWFLSAGPQPPNPADLLSSRAMEELLASLRGRFDHLVVDTPPVLMVTDATVLSPFVDGVILVTESQVTGRAALARTHRILEGSRAKIIGCVLNKLDLRHDGYYGSYYRYYGRYYSQDSRGKGLARQRQVTEPAQSADKRGA
ncbi:MAG: polysaccharide biosynthesis tyrosine autokinase [Acidobacteriota bacterium]